MGFKRVILKDSHEFPELHSIQAAGSLKLHDVSSNGELLLLELSSPLHAPAFVIGSFQSFEETGDTEGVIEVCVKDVVRLTNPNGCIMPQVVQPSGRLAFQRCGPDIVNDVVVVSASGFLSFCMCIYMRVCV